MASVADPRQMEVGFIPRILGWQRCKIQMCKGKRAPCRAAGGTHRVPLVVNVLGAERDVGVSRLWPQSVCLADLLDLPLDAQDGASLSVSLRQCCLELFMCC